jgi:hypothetical protein
MTTPLMNICQNAEIPTSGRLLRMMPRNRQPSTTPSAEPTPPAIATPPMRQAAITCSSKPSAMSV